MYHFAKIGVTAIITGITLLFINNYRAMSQAEPNIVTDIDGNSYRTVVIGNQIWFRENLKVTRLNDGTVIPYVSEANAWKQTNQAAYCKYNNDNANKDKFGALYNWFAVNTGRLCPEGWHIPDTSDWEELTGYLGGIEDAGGRLKEQGVTHWNPPNAGAKNDFYFSALPGGYRWSRGPYDELGLNGYWWSATECTETHAWSITMHAGNSKLYKSFFIKNKGFSVRCIKGD